LVLPLFSFPFPDFLSFYLDFIFIKIILMFFKIMPSANFSSELAKVKATGQPFVDRLFSADPQVQWESVNDMRNLTAGNRRQKANFIVVGAIPRLVYIIQQNDCMDELKRDCITLLTSLAKGF
jgi:hypothetical protein